MKEGGGLTVQWCGEVPRGCGGVPRGVPIYCRAEDLLFIESTHVWHIEFEHYLSKSYLLHHYIIVYWLRGGFTIYGWGVKVCTVLKIFYFIQYQSNTTFFLFHIFWVPPPTPMAYGVCTLHSMYKSYLLHH